MLVWNFYCVRSSQPRKLPIFLNVFSFISASDLLEYMLMLFVIHEHVKLELLSWFWFVHVIVLIRCMMFRACILKLGSFLVRHSNNVHYVWMLLFIFCYKPTNVILILNFYIKCWDASCFGFYKDFMLRDYKWLLVRLLSLYVQIEKMEKLLLESRELLQSKEFCQKIARNFRLVASCKSL